jgi:protoporphyrin/coproporphyrin ferrochelatase
MSERPCDALLLLSFGGPEQPDDVLPFLENVTRGRGVPRERLEVVAQQYMRFGGRSPINDECRRLMAALERELEVRGPRLPVYWGNRNWHPMLADTVATMARDGVRRAVAVATSAFSSYSGCRQYLEDIERARDAVGPEAPLIEKLPPFWNTPGFLETMTEHTRDAMRIARGRASATPSRSRKRDEETRLVFTAHSLPAHMAEGCDYVAELREAASIVALGAAPGIEWDLAFQSRSGAPSQPWLEPDVGDHLRALSERDVESVVVVPIGFVADHMEVLYDLDTQAREVADSLSIDFVRARTVGAAPRFVAGLRDFIADHVEGKTPRTLGTRGARPWPCAPGCCAAGQSAGRPT